MLNPIEAKGIDKSKIDGSSSAFTPVDWALFLRALFKNTVKS